MIRVGLLGTGGMAGVYADRIADIDGATVTAVASPNTADSFVADHVPDAAAYADAKRLCRDADVDAVAVLSPTHTHPELVEAAASEGLDVICEKPVARTLDGAETIRDAVEDAGITFMVAHVTRFFPEYAEARERVDDGVVGTPGVVRTRRAFGFEGSRGWFDDPELSGGILLDLAIHDFDYLRWTLGAVEHVFTRQVDWTDEGRSDVSLTLVRFESGAVAHVESWAVEGPSVPFTTAFEIAGDEGHLEYDVDDVRSVVHYGRDGVHTPRDPIGDDIPLRRDGYARQLEHFFECVRTGAEPSVPIEEGIASLRVALAAIESGERGEPVAVEGGAR
jgi:predicted dehydrogenase